MNSNNVKIDREKLNEYSRRSYAKRILNNPQHAEILRQRAIIYYRKKHPMPNKKGRPKTIHDDDQPSKNKIGRHRKNIIKDSPIII